MGWGNKNGDGMELHVRIFRHHEQLDVGFSTARAGPPRAIFQRSLSERSAGIQRKILGRQSVRDRSLRNRQRMQDRDNARENDVPCER